MNIASRLRGIGVFGRFCEAALLIAVLIVFAAGCSSGNGNIAITLSTGATQAVDLGQSFTITATVEHGSDNAGVAWALTSGPGALTNATTTSVTYTANGATGTAVITATAVKNKSKTATVTVTVTAMPSITTATLPAVTEGTAYSQVIAKTGGAGTVSFSVSVGALPPGLALSSSGTISGTATGPNGTSNFTIKIIDASTVAPQSATQALTLVVNLPAPPTITTASLPAGVEGAAYSQQIAASGLAPLTFTTSAGSLPPGLTLSNSGLISGTPLGPMATSNFTVKVTDSSNPMQSTTQALSIAVNLPAPPSVTTTTLPAGVEGSVYNQTISATGGLGALVFSISSGNLPAGLTMSTAGVITGTPTGPNGTASFTVLVTDHSTPPQTGTKVLSIVTNLQPAPTITPTSLPGGSVGTAYSQTLTVSNGLSPYTWNVSAGTLPAGLTLTYNGTTATVSGTPTTAQANVAFTIEVTDSSNPKQNGSEAYTVTITPAQPLVVTTSSSQLPNAIIGTAYTTSAPLATLAASGGVPPYTWDTAPLTGILPDGLTLNAGGQIIGTVAADAVTESFTVQVSDSATPTHNEATSASLTITVVGAGAHNSYLSGTYVCLAEGFKDSDQSRWANVSSIVADGKGNITSGVWDTNGTDFTTGALSGTLTGTYSVGADNNGVLSTTADTVTNQWAIAISNLAGPTAQEFRRVETGDAGATPSGQHGTGHCYLATQSAFTASTFNGNSFVWVFRGEGSSQIPVASVGRLSASGGSYSNCYIDYADGSAAVQSDTCAGTLTNPDPTTGRFTATFTPTKSTTRNWVVYIIDANRAFMLNTTAQSGTEAGELRKQQQSSYSNANLTGPFVLYGQGYDFSGGTVSGYYAQVFQGTGSGAGSVTINESYKDDDGTYKTGNGNGTVDVTFDSSNPGRATVATKSGTGYLYFFGTNLAVEMSSGAAEWGWVEAQTESTFTDAAVAGSYMEGKIALLEESANGNIGVVTLASNGNVSGSGTSAGPGSANLNQPISATYSWASTEYGTALVTSSNGDASCVIISSTRFACIGNTDEAPNISIFQQ